MADKDKDKDKELNLGKDEELDESEESSDQEKGKGGKKKIIIIVGAVLGALLIGGAAMFFLMSGDSSEPPVDGAKPGVDGAEEVVKKPVKKKVKKKVKKVVKEEVEDRDPIYQVLVKDFVVTFGEGEDIRYLQLSLDVMSYDQTVIDKVVTNLPAVRNSLIMLIGSQHYDDLNTNKGKERLRKKILGAVRKAARLKKTQKLESAFYTGFVLQ